MKIGRNDPCHCGNGKKYKKCCLLEDEKKAYNEDDSDYLDQVFEEYSKSPEHKEFLKNEKKHSNMIKGSDPLAIIKSFICAIEAKELDEFDKGINTENILEIIEKGENHKELQALKLLFEELHEIETERFYKIEKIKDEAVKIIGASNN